MLNIPRKYIVDESNEKIAVQLDIETFVKIEDLLVDYALGQILENEDKEDEVLNEEDAKSYYAKLTKRD